MDYKNNQRYFDTKFNQTTSKIFIVSGAALGLAILLYILRAFVGGIIFVILRYAGTPLIVIGVILLFIALSRIVKESEVTGDTDSLIKALNDECLEKLEYPSDADEKSLVFAGCRITNDNIDRARKLKSGNYINEDLIISFFYEKNGVVSIKQRTISLVKEGTTDVEMKLSLDDFDSVRIETDTLKNDVKVNFVRFFKDNKIVFEAPLVDNDYYKEEYFKTIMHDKEKSQNKE